MPLMKSLLAVSFLAGVTACGLPSIVERIDCESPRAELGRPGWVRLPATAGSWVGGVVGAVASIPVLVVSAPISWLSSDSTGRLGDEFVFAPVGAGAATGHYLLGAPFDSLDWLFRRAWIGESPIAAEAATEGRGVVASRRPGWPRPLYLLGPSDLRIVASRDDSPAYGPDEAGVVIDGADMAPDPK